MHPAPEWNPSGKVALITGASQGIGKEVALHLARLGMRLVLSSRNAEKLMALAAEIEQAHPGTPVLVVPCDVTRPDQVERVVNDAMAEFKRIDVLVNNAGIAPRVGLLQELSIEEIDRTIDTNLKGAIYCMRAVIPVMVAQQGGIIINVNSVAGKTAYPYWSVYDASKFGLHAVTEAVADEQRSNHIKVVGIYPGAVDTPIWDGLGLDQEPDYNGMLDARNVAEAITYIIRQPEKVHVREIVLAPLRPAL